jgi:DNA-binding response OmpR family regulator
MALALGRAALSILVVEDDEALRGSIRDVLSAQGFWVDVAASGSEALRHVLVRKYHIVISDLSVPKVDGIELARLLSRRIDSPRIILTSGNPDPGWVKVALDAGASRVVSKPLDLTSLIGVVEELGLAEF